MLSFCIPVYNEEQILLSYLDKIEKGLSKLLGRDNYEIIIVDNGSTDKTVDILQKIKKPHVRIFYVAKKGHGIAYRRAIEQAKGEVIVLSAIDIPFGFTDIIEARKYWDTYDILFGSKAHPKSKVYIPFKRKISSFVYQSLLKLLFHTNIGDTQGSVILTKKAAMKILPYCTAENAFFTAQIAIYGRFFHIKMKEIAVTHDFANVTVRKSKYNIIKDGKIMFNSMIEEQLKVNRLKGEK